MMIRIGWLLVTLCLASTASGEPLNRTISVQGQASVAVVPDRVRVRFQVHGFDKELSKAKEDNDQAAMTILKLIKDIGVADDDIQTDQMSSEAVYDSEYVDRRLVRQGELKGYSVRRDYSLVLKDITKFQQLSNHIVGNPSYSMKGFEFESSSAAAHMETARARALQAARAKAITSAAALDCMVGKPISITETESYGGAQLFSGGTRETDGVVKVGQTELTACFWVVFELEPK